MTQISYDMLTELSVDHAIKATFRLKRDPKLAFQHFSSFEKRVTQFRFLAQSFVTSISSYIYDVAIGGLFDRFSKRIATGNHGFQDVMDLAQAHSHLLDNVLAACLLRSHQKAIGNDLRDSLEVILEFAVTMGNVDESDETDVIEDLFASFNHKTASLV